MTVGERVQDISIYQSLLYQLIVIVPTMARFGYNLKKFVITKFY